MLLNNLCNSQVYHQNAFYLLGINVNMSGRQLKRRIEDIRSAGEMGEVEWNREYDSITLGSQVAPPRELFDELIERIKDPEYFITESFFWFWPVEDGGDVAIEAISKGNREKAYNAWRELSNKSTVSALVAKHNLAVLFHYYAIDAENQRLQGYDGTDSKIYADIVDRYWRTSFSYWEMLVDDDEFWDVFADRVRAIDDPRLGQDFIADFRVQFPISFDNINADYLVAYAKAGRFEDARRHFVYMTETMSGSDDVDETLNAAFKPQIDKLQIQIRHCRDSKVAEDGLKDVQAVLEGSKELFRIFGFLLPPENRMRRDLMNDVAKTCHGRLPSYANKTDDFESALLVERDLLPLASTSSLQNAIKDAISKLEEIVKDKRDADTCWYCKTYRKGTPKRTVKLYGNVTPDFSQIGRVTYSTRQIHVLVCDNCNYRFTTMTCKDYPPIKMSLDNGWKLGDGPSDAEIDAVWLDVADVLKGAFGRRGY